MSYTLFILDAGHTWHPLPEEYESRAEARVAGSGLVVQGKEGLVAYAVVANDADEELLFAILAYAQIYESRRSEERHVVGLDRVRVTILPRAYAPSFVITIGFSGDIKAGFTKEATP